MANQFTKGRRDRHMDGTREKIQAAQIINRLHGCVMGTVELTAQQVAAAKVLLAKVLPDLQATELTGEVTHAYVVEVPAKPASTDEWKQQHAPTTVQ